MLCRVRESCQILSPLQVHARGLEIENNCGNQVVENEGKKKKKKEMLCPQHFYNIFTTNYKWLVVIGSNLNLILRLRFCPNNNN